MKRLTLMTVILAALAVIASAQSMTKSSSPGDADASSMMAPADSNMAAPADSMKASPGSMMNDDMSYESLKKANKLADVKIGMELRAAMSSGMKTPYRNLMSAEALAMKGPTILFFSADWCPYCQADLRDINANGMKLGKVNIVVVDYDASADLRTKYGVTVQDTYVQIGAMGEKLGVWNGGGVEGILQNVKGGM